MVHLVPQLFAGGHSQYSSLFPTTLIFVRLRVGTWISTRPQPSGCPPRGRSNGGFPPTPRLAQRSRPPVYPGDLPRFQSSNIQLQMVADRGINFLKLSGWPKSSRFEVARRSGTGAAVRRRSTVATRRQDRFNPQMDASKLRGCIFDGMDCLLSSGLLWAVWRRRRAQSEAPQGALVRDFLGQVPPRAARPSSSTRNNSSRPPKVRGCRRGSNSVTLPPSCPSTTC